MDVVRRLLLLGLMCASTGARATDVCQAIPPAPATYAQRIANVACLENRLWFSPFIDTDGHLASIQVAEAENSRLGDGVTPAWKRVVDYWKGSGLLWQMTGTAGASDCAYPGDERIQASSCRAFVVDTPWSAAFVSFVMVQAGVPRFRSSASHIDFVRDAYLHPDASPFRFSDPDNAKPAPGDVLCFARSSSTTLGHQGFKDYLEHDGGSLNMHCEVVVAANASGDGKAYLVGGNVLQGVTMRELHLNRNGMLWSLPRRFGRDTACGPDNAAGCSFNRQDWVVLLKLDAALATTIAPAPMQPMASPAPKPSMCCLKCAEGVAPGVPRC
jgi:hypothetical protein